MEFSKKHIFMSACAVLLKFCAQNGVTVYLGINMTVLSIGWLDGGKLQNSNK